MNAPKTTTKYDDGGHRDHAKHFGEVPKIGVDAGPSGIRVTLDSWGPQDGKFFANLYNQCQSNWGDAPSAVQYDHELTPHHWAFIENTLSGRGLVNPLEAMTFAFTIDGITRACTHEIVRTRIGASFMQHGGRDNDWRHRRFTMPETIIRAVTQEKYPHVAAELAGKVGKLVHPIDLRKYTSKLDEYCDELDVDFFREELEDRDDDESDPQDPLSPQFSYLEGSLMVLLRLQKAVYAALVDSGVPWQDARRFIGIGHQTYLHANYNYPSLQGVLANRLEHIMDWEINCVAQLMLCEIHRKCPPVIAKTFGSHSDKAHIAKFAGLDSWPSDGKWPMPGDVDPDRMRTHRTEQMLFWVLDPRCFSDKNLPIVWIPTNGTFPHAEYAARGGKL